MIVMIFLLASLPSNEAVVLKNKTNTTADKATITIHAFYDLNKNNIQDSADGEGDAGYFHVYASEDWLGPIFYPITKVGKTDINGDITFEWEEGKMLFVDVYDDLNFKRGYVGRIGSAMGGPFIWEDTHFEVACQYYEPDAKSSIPSITNVLYQLFDNFPMICNLLIK